MLIFVRELNRLTSLWEESVAPALAAIQQQAEARIGALRAEAARVERNEDITAQAKVQASLHPFVPTPSPHLSPQARVFCDLYSRLYKGFV
jgi:hypothetical protein